MAMFCCQLYLEQTCYQASQAVKIGRAICCLAQPLQVFQEGLCRCEGVLIRCPCACLGCLMGRLHLLQQPGSDLIMRQPLHVPQGLISNTVSYTKSQCS